MAVGYLLQSVPYPAYLTPALCNLLKLLVLRLDALLERALRMVDAIAGGTMWTHWPCIVAQSKGVTCRNSSSSTAANESLQTIGGVQGYSHQTSP